MNNTMSTAKHRVPTPIDRIDSLVKQRDALVSLLRDGQFQLARLTGEDLYQYARTFAALAKNAIAKAEGEL